MMEPIKLPQMRLAQLQTYTDHVIELTEPLAAVATHVQAVKDAYQGFQEGMTKVKASSDKKTLDRTRDAINSGFFKSVEGEQSFPHQDSGIIQTLEQVVNITDRYGFGLNRLSYDEQSAETDNLLSELKKLDLTALPHIERWIAPMEAANNDFKSAAKDFLEDVTTSGNTKAAYLAAKPLEDALSALLTVLFANLIVAKTDELEAAHQQLETLTNTYK